MQSDAIERIAKKYEFAKKVLLGFMNTFLAMVFYFVSFFTNCMLCPLFSGLLHLNGMNERNRSPLWDGMTDSIIPLGQESST